MTLHSRGRIHSRFCVGNTSLEARQAITAEDAIGHGIAPRSLGGLRLRTSRQKAVEAVAQTGDRRLMTINLPAVVLVYNKNKRDAGVIPSLLSASGLRYALVSNREFVQLQPQQSQSM